MAFHGPPPGGGQGVGVRSYAGIASINTSVRDEKNVLEIRLEKSEGAKFNLTISEIESLLVKLGIDAAHFLGVSPCPEGKGVVFITLHPAVNINRFLHKQESYILKKGVQTTVIRPAGKKEVSVFISGLHPNTKDQAVLRYLAAHGKVSQKEKVIHHVFPGEQGSSLLAGKLNGDRSYMVEITKPMGSFHIIDGEKVSVKYRSQARTCARCHMTACSGKGIARDCLEDRVLLSAHMEKHWKEIGFKPDSNTSFEEEDTAEIEIQIGRASIAKRMETGPDLTHRYSSIIISGFSADQDMTEIHQLLLAQGLPQSFDSADIVKTEKSGKLTIKDLSPQDCLLIMEKMHGQKFLGKKVFVTSVVSGSPSKPRQNPESTNVPKPPPLPLPSPLLASQMNLKITQHLRPTATKQNLASLLMVHPPLINSLQHMSSSSVSDSEPEASSLPVSPNMQAKIDLFDKEYRRISNAEKRKAIESPEKFENTFLSKSEVKKLKKENKQRRRLEHKEAEKKQNQLNVC